jgi:CDP-diacylglycerol--inositol 3-phosphatidyltransferase
MNSDGMVARKLNQTSTFGGLLDMVTDRCSTLGLLYVLGGDYAKVGEVIGFPVFRCVSVILT